MIGSMEYNWERGRGIGYIVCGIIYGRCDEGAKGEGLWHNPSVTKCARYDGSFGVWSKARGGGDTCD